MLIQFSGGNNGQDRDTHMTACGGEVHSAKNVVDFSTTNSTNTLSGSLLSLGGSGVI